MDDAATGPPAALLDARDELTPMLSQYLDLCEAHEDSLVIFQNGDFYQSYCEVAETVARVCEVTLTQREDSTGTYAMAGLPVDNAASYLERLLDAGYSVAVAEQVEDAEAATGLVDRAVTQVVTPGTVVEDELLDSGTARYVAAVTAAGDAAAARAGDPAADATFALAAVDVSTGDCLVTSVDAWSRLVEELERLAPAEVLSPDVALDHDAVETAFTHTPVDGDRFAREAATETLSGYVHRPDAVVANDAERRAVGGVLAYAEYTQGGERLDYVSRITRYDPRESLRLDATALRSLELFESRSHRTGETLLETLDETACALGRRRLSTWLRRPLVDREAIEARHDAVGELADATLTRETLREHLREVYDVERLIGRVSRGRANARDLRSLATTLSVVPTLREALADAESERLRALREDLDPLADVRDLLDRAIVADPPQELTEGGVVREGFDAELDDLRATEREGREWVSDLEARERERTGIDSIDVGYNQVHGYYIEVTNPNLDHVPEDYQRRQTLKNSERFYTPELKRREDEILGAAERADKLEYELFVEVRDEVAAEAERVQALASALAELDALASFAAVAVARDYVRPTLADREGSDREGAGIRVEGGRHPVVERTRDAFVPNDAALDRGEVAVITGPNMSGKSTYMRQVALIVVLAQAGSFVPADAATLPVVDRVFTRVGASDDIAGGQSTFMREMAELTEILHGATDDSLVLLDEVGRGTSTVDGLAIAWATAEFVHDEIGATTLFATHYHDLTALAERRERVTNLHFSAVREDDDVTFLHRVESGPSSSSYGVEVARMAGVPDAVVERARTLVAEGVPVERAGSGDPEGGPAAREAGSSADHERTLAGRDGAPTAGDAPAAAANGHAEGDAASDGRTGVDVAGDGRATEEPTAAQPPLDAYADGRPDPGSLAGDGAEDLAEVASEIRELNLAETTPLEALNALHDLQQRLDD